MLRGTGGELAGNWLETCGSLPFGEDLACSGAADVTPIHFTGKERDTESSLDNFGARYYASSMGRFMSIDPAFESEILEFPRKNRGKNRGQTGLTPISRQQK
jgi:RHS repeat-associated protein